MKIKEIVNGNDGLFINGKFAGIFIKTSERTLIEQYSGNKDQIFDVLQVCEVLKSMYPKIPLFFRKGVVGSQQWFQITTKKTSIEEGIWYPY